MGVSWYEAIAFCRWLSHEVGTEITLPSEAQWERAASHIDGRLYPWGNNFDATKCNMRETGIGHTSAVGFFSAGNVLEWCSTQWLDDYNDYEQKVDNGL